MLMNGMQSLRPSNFIDIIVCSDAGGGEGMQTIYHDLESALVECRVGILSPQYDGFLFLRVFPNDTLTAMAWIERRKELRESGVFWPLAS